MRLRNLALAAILTLIGAPASAQFVRFPSIEIGTVAVGCRYQSLDVADDNPNGDVSGSVCDQVNEASSGIIWTKTSGSATTSGWVALTTSSSTGTVTSVALTAPGIFSVAGSPITTSGTLAISLASQSANVVFAGPASGAATTPGFRQIVFDDIDDNGCASGQVPKWDGDSWECADDAGASSGAPTSAQYITLAVDGTLTNERVLTEGANIDITDAGAGSTVTIALPSVVDLGGNTLEIPHSNTLPATCTVGELYKDDNATSGQQLYACEATNTWALQGDGGGGGGGSTTQGDYASLPGTCTTGDLYVLTDSVYDLVRCSATNTWSFFLDGKLKTLPGTTASWTGVNTASDWATDDTLGPITFNINRNATLNWRGLFKTQPATPYTVTYEMSALAWAANSSLFGVYFYDGTKLMSIEILTQNGVSNTLRVQKITNVTTDSGTAASVASAGFLPGPSTIGGHYYFPSIWMRLQNNGSDLTFYFSHDGVYWIQLFTEAIGTFITPTHYGFGGANISSTATDDVVVTMKHVKVN